MKIGVLAAVIAALVFSTPVLGTSAPNRTVRFTTQEGTWLSPTLSPDGRTIVFELLGDLYTIPATGSKTRRITSGNAFDSQPAFSPDGRLIAFVSDRSGAENLWVARVDGTQARQVTFRDDDCVLTSPTWAADGLSLFVSHVRNDLNAFEMWRVDVASGAIATIIPVDQASTKVSSLSPSASADGRWLYYAARIDDAATAELPIWTIRRRDLKSGMDENILAPPRSYRPDLLLGTMFRPAIARDGRRLVYATRRGAITWLRLRDLDSGYDRWIAPLADRDELGAVSAWRDLIPAASFTPDGKGLIVGDAGGLRRIDIESGTAHPIAFAAKVDIPVGAPTRIAIAEASGPVRARIIQAPEQSPDGNRLAFAAFGQVHVMPLDTKGMPQRLSQDAATTAQPSWSPDGTSITYVSWQAAKGGHVWIAEGGAPPRRISDTAAYYTTPVFTPDGQSVITLRSDRDERNHRYMEYGPLRETELVIMPRAGGPARVLARGKMGGKPHFSGAGNDVHLLFETGLVAVPLDGGPRRNIVQITGPGFYFEQGRAPVDDMRLSPDGRFLLIQSAQQLNLVDRPRGDGKTIDLAAPELNRRRVTRVGADYFDWADGGKTITWSIGSTFYRAAVDRPSEALAQRYTAEVVLPRPVPPGSILLRGATVVTMGQAGIIADADLLVTADRVAAIGPRGSFAVPADAQVRDVSGRWVVPGLIDAHDHRADIRRGVLDTEMWSASASLAYGITTLFDPSTLTVDMLVYEDMIDAGLITGARLRSTATALFSFNAFNSKADVASVLSRYRDHYRVRNIKMYRTGNRRVRQWIADTAREMGLMPTTEGAGSTKLGLTMIMDGFAGHEHVMPTVPIHGDITRFLAQTRTSYTGTLMIAGNPSAQDWFIVRDRQHDDAKLNMFTPRFIVDMKLRARPWFVDDAYRFPAYAKGLADVARSGGLVAIGSHGEMPGIGYHWEMRAHRAGGMTPAEILHASTIGSAEAIGRTRDLGSLEPGKFADLLVLARDPLQAVENLAAIDFVMKAGRLYDAQTLDTVYPEAVKFPKPWYRDEGAPPGAK